MGQAGMRRVITRSVRTVTTSTWTISWMSAEDRHQPQPRPDSHQNDLAATVSTPDAVTAGLVSDVQPAGPESEPAAAPVNDTDTEPVHG